MDLTRTGTQALLVSLLFLTACPGAGETRTSAGAGPGGATDPTTGVAGGVAKWHGGGLPGTIIIDRAVNDGAARKYLSYAYDMATGVRTVLPVSDGADPSEIWGYNGSVPWRFESIDEVLTVFNDWPATNTGAANMTYPKKLFASELSRDGKYLLGSLYTTPTEDYGDRELTLFSVSGSVVERGSLQGVGNCSGHCATWLPDGSYLYMVEKKVYTARPGQKATLLFELTGLPSVDVANDPNVWASPDGTKFALTWRERRGYSHDRNIWVVNVDGSGLHRLTTPPANDALDFSFANPAWSPDGKYIAFGQYWSGVVTAPVFPDEPFGGSRIIGTVGCGTYIHVLPVEAENVVFPMGVNPEYAVAVPAPNGDGMVWLGGCGGGPTWVP